MAKNNETKGFGKGLGISIIIASLILAGVMMYGFHSISQTLTKSPEKESEPDRLAVKESDHVKGPDKALVTIVEYSDFQDPFSKEFYSNLERLREEYEDEVRWVYRHFPVTSLHPESKKAAIASECADEQGKFWEYAKELFENQDNLNKETYLSIAEDLKFNVINFENCLKSDEIALKVANEYNQATKIGVRGTPSTFINKKSMLGAVSYNALKAEVESVISKETSSQR